MYAQSYVHHIWDETNWNYTPYYEHLHRCVHQDADREKAKAAYAKLYPRRRRVMHNQRAAQSQAWYKRFGGYVLAGLLGTIGLGAYGVAALAGEGPFRQAVIKAGDISFGLIEDSIETLRGTGLIQ